jgi:hypothetical protein
MITKTAATVTKMDSNVKDVSAKLDQVLAFINMQSRKVCPTVLKSGLCVDHVYTRKYGSATKYKNWVERRKWSWLVSFAALRSTLRWYSWLGRQAAR